MNSQEIRKKFLLFFKKKSHKILPSSPIVIYNDPSLLFTNSGMNAFKEYFLGQKKSNYKRIANIQKCLRVSGKHNDLESVGYDNYHHTMFEMLGNWSFEDYFKKEAIEWSWELLTKVYKIPKEDLYVTIFSGDEKDKLCKDVESNFFWEKKINKKNILFFGKKHNFWEMGDSGPCGPSSEIHIDLRNIKEKKNIPGINLINKNHPDVIELWNIVFIEFLRKKNGNLESLNFKYVDTGMGFERLCRVLQKKSSNYETDIFSSLISKVEELSSFKYGKNIKVDIAIKIIVDHMRSIIFSIYDGQNPSNTGAGYIIRKLLRRAINYGYRFLNQKEAFLYKLSEVFINNMSNNFPELINQKKLISDQIKYEEISFFKTLSIGTNKIKSIIKEINKKKQKYIDGKKIFELYDTYGFPLDLSKIIAKENNLEINEKEFNNKMNIQKKRSLISNNIENDDWIIVNNIFFDSKKNFFGYDKLIIETYICRYRRIRLNNNIFYQIVFSDTPFYAESGGQVGDTGYIENKEEKIFIINTYKENDLYIHITNKIPKNINSIFKAVVNYNRRKNIEKNHSATHLLHYSLKEILGNHIIQKGSYINEDKLRFDFSHSKKISYEELKNIEEYVQNMINKNFILDEKRNISLNSAISQGAISFFGEKYGNEVRTISFGPSLELCCGTHVKKSKEIELFKILSESSVGSGIRRIEACSSKFVISYLNNIEKEYIEIINKINKTSNPIKFIENIKKENKNLRHQLNNLTYKISKNVKKEWYKKIKKYKKFNIISKQSDLNFSLIKKISLELRTEYKKIILLIVNIEKNNVNICISVSDDLINKGVNAFDIIKKLLPYINGKGSGKNSFAIGKGDNIKGIKEIFNSINNFNYI